MDLVVFLVRGETENTYRFYVFIKSFNISVGVVKDIVLYFPIERIASKEVDDQSEVFVDGFVFWIGIVVGIMHDRESNSCHTHSHDKVQGKNDPGIGNQPA